MLNTANSALIEECDSTIKKIEEKDGMVGCEAHDVIASGIVTLLRCNKANLSQNRDIARQAVFVSAISTGIVFAALKFWCG